MTLPLRDNTDTIAAPVTPAGEGGIAVLRVSGPRAVAITDISFAGAVRLAEARTHTLHFGRLLDAAGAVLDQVVAAVYRAPHSYTGEDTVELSCHGGWYLSQKILALLLTNGARMAEPGEYTLRAFLNGKMDLTQAEAVADLIAARTEKAHRASLEQLEGKLSRFIGTLRQELMDQCSLFELELDFSEDDITLTDRGEAARALTSTIEKLRAAIASYHGGKLVREGVTAVLAGKPNAGKSSLLNLLLEEQRAIVSSIPGTTRDAIEESVSLEGLLFHFVDTAGLRETADEIEQEGVRRTHRHMKAADIILVMIDSSHAVSLEDQELYRQIERTVSPNAVLMYVFNKSDQEAPDFARSVAGLEAPHCTISCTTHEGIARFKEMLCRLALPQHDAEAGSITVTSLRHKQSLEAACEALTRARSGVESNASGDLVAIDLREALDALGAIIGSTTPDDILNNIFSKFCIGK